MLMLWKVRQCNFIFLFTDHINAMSAQSQSAANPPKKKGKKTDSSKEEIWLALGIHIKDLQCVHLLFYFVDQGPTED